VTDRRESELVRLGFIPLCHAKGTDKAVFFSVQSCHKPKLYVHSDANVNANLVVRLDYILATSRFAHYMKVMMRDKMGKFKNHEECEAYLNGWIASYVLLDDSASMEQRAKYPLREARIEVLAIPGRARAFKAIAHLKPHFQLDDLTVPMRLRVSLPQSPSS
jgi:type VI secretion system protein ImpC